MEFYCRFGFSWRRFRDRFGTTRWSMFSLLQFSKFPDKARRDRPVVSDTTLTGRNDSPLLVGPDERKGDK